MVKSIPGRREKAQSLRRVNSFPDESKKIRASYAI